MTTMGSSVTRIPALAFVYLRTLRYNSLMLGCLLVPTLLLVLDWVFRGNVFSEASITYLEATEVLLVDLAVCYIAYMYDSIGILPPPP